MAFPKSKINILIVNDHLGYNGKILLGGGRLFLQWLRTMDKDKFNPHLCILRKKDRLNRFFEEYGIEVKYLGKGKFNPLTLLSLIKMVRDLEIDLMHVSAYGGTTFGRLARIITGVPVLVHFHDTNTFYPFVQKVADNLLARFTDAGLAVSESVKRFNIENHRVVGMAQESIRVMHNCIPIESFKELDDSIILAVRKELGVAQHQKIVGTVTRFYEQKGNKYLIESIPEILKACPNTVFVLLGDGPLRSNLEELVQGFGIQNNVIFTGFRDAVSKYLAAFDIKVFPSYEEGGSPLPILEAMAMGKPIVVTSVVEIIEDNATGLVVPPKDPGAIAAGIVSLLKNDKLARKLAANAQHRSRNFDTKLYVRKLEKLYEEVVRSRPVKKRTV